MFDQMEKCAWYHKLQKSLLKAVQEVYEPSWTYSEEADRAFSSDIVDIQGEFEVEKFVFDRDNQELVVYAKIIKEVSCIRDIHELVHRVFCISDEDYFLFVPLHTKDVFQFWFLTGYQSHNHKGRVIVWLENGFVDNEKL